MCHRHCIKHLRKIVRDTTQKNSDSGGLNGKFAEDSQQFLPVLLRGFTYDPTDACIRFSNTFSALNILYLVESMKIIPLNQIPVSSQEVLEFSQLLHQVGEQRLPKKLKTKFH